MSFFDFYSRQLALAEVGPEGQTKLQQGKCLVVGAGGLGSAALHYLAAAGLGTLGICDADIIAISNLHRQPLYSMEAIGAKKALIAAEKLRKLNPFIEIKAHPERLSQANYEALLAPYDLILDCTDNFSSKYLLNDTCFLLKKPLVRASIHRFEGQLHFTLPIRQDACLRCIWPKIPVEDCARTCTEVGVLGPLPGFFGVLQAMEALKFFLGLPLLEKNTLLAYDLLTHSQKKIMVGKSEACPVCMADRKAACFDAYWEMEPHDAQAYESYWVDIRENEEVSKDPLSENRPVLHLPLSCFDPTSLDPKGHYVFFCHSGKRSRHLVTLLRKKGWENAYSLKGGILALRHL
jgi:molybdopterin/thiamine biosynthesis adenylyltransferase/rhodanese-related sulfurtransferase